MSSLPQLAQLEFDVEEIDDESTDRHRVHTTLDWDFDKGDFKLIGGKTTTLTGIPYLKVWIQSALNTDKHTLLYTESEFGSAHRSLIGTTFKMSYAESEYKRMISEALLVNDAIINVSNFTFEQKGSRLLISFDVESIYGSQSEEVTI